MKTKKNPKIDPKRNSFLYFQIGLVAVCLLSYIGIEAKFYESVTPDLPKPKVFDDFLEEESTYVLPPVKKKLKPIQKPKQDIPIYSADKPIEVVSNSDTDVVESTDVMSSDTLNVDLNLSDFVEVDINKLEEVVTVDFTKVESVPVFPGCEGVPEEKRIACFNEKIMKHVSKNLHYPEEALSLGIEGQVHLMFVIDENGRISEVEKRGTHHFFEKEAVRVIKSLPTIQPGMQRGKPVKVRFAMPVKFKQ